MSKAKEQSIVPPLSKPEKLLSAREIMLHLHNEHKYMSKLLNVLNEQRALIEDGEVPDLAIMQDIARYMHEYSDVSHHAKEDVIYGKLATIDEVQKSDIVNLLIDHEASSKKTEALTQCIESTMQDPSRDNLEMLKLRCEDYITSMNRHMDHEESQVFPLILETLSEDDWADIINDIQPANDPLFGQLVAQKYENLMNAISNEMERAAEDFAMAEWVGLGASMESIGLIATYGNAITKTISQHCKQAWKSNTVAFRKLRQSKSHSVGDYASVTIDCMLNNYDSYTDVMYDIGKILRKARAQMAEPYTTRLRIYHDMTRNP
jgi:hemerythrin-like domain-containing protein